MLEVAGLILAIVIATGGYAAWVISASRGVAKAEVVSVRALAETTNQTLLAHQEEDRENYLDLKDDLREIKSLLKKMSNDAEGPIQ